MSRRPRPAWTGSRSPSATYNKITDRRQQRESRGANYKAVVLMFLLLLRDRGGIIEIQFIEMAQQESSSQAYGSRYKSMQSEEDTRNPTTSKKIHGTPVQFRRSNPYHSAHDPPRPHTAVRSLSEQLNMLQARKLQCMREGRLRQAQVLHERIARTRSMEQQQRVSMLARSQKKEKRAVSGAHRSEMQHLHRVWHEYFQQLRQREIDILQSFKAYQRQEIRSARDKLQKRCASLRSHSRQKADLLRKEQQLMGESRFKEVRAVRRQLQELAEREQAGRRRQAGRWAELEQERLSVSQSRKYSALMSRLEQYRQDKEKVYVREQKRLKQKYKNVLAQLHHEQAMEISALNRALTFQH